MRISPPRRTFSAIDYLGDVPWIEDEAAKGVVCAGEIPPVVPPPAERMAGGRAGVAHLCGTSTSELFRHARAGRGHPRLT